MICWDFGLAVLLKIESYRKCGASQPTQNVIIGLSTE